jgi:hypothetical protein
MDLRITFLKWEWSEEGVQQCSGMFCSIYSGYRLCVNLPPIMRGNAPVYALEPASPLPIMRNRATDYA